VFNMEHRSPRSPMSSRHCRWSAVLSVVGLFHGVIAQSGVATAPYSVYSRDEGIDFRKYVRDVGHLFSCHGGQGSAELDDVIACLRRVPQHDIIAKRGNVSPSSSSSSFVTPKKAACEK